MPCSCSIYDFTEGGYSPACQRQVRISEADIDYQIIRGSGPGGQKRNKTSNCVLLKHLGLDLN